VKRSKEVTPVKVALLYSMALVLVALAELPRLYSWAEEAQWKLSSGQIFAELGANLFKLLPRASDTPGSSGQDQKDASTRSDLEVTEVAQSTVSEPPSTQNAGQDAAPDSGGGAHTECPVVQDPLQAQSPEIPAPVTSPPKLEPHKALLVGDSMIAEGFGPALQRRLRKYKSLTVVRKGQYSTGFVHQEDFNWTSVLKELIQQDKPDMLVIHMGTNDPIDILDGSSKRLYFGTDEWKEVYASRVGEFLKLISENKIQSFWVGLPIMGSDKYCDKISTINSIFEQECSKVSGCVYFDAWPVLADSSGNYTTFLKGAGGKQTRIRAKDRVHLTEVGGDILSQHFLKSACRYIELPTDDEVSTAKR